VKSCILFLSLLLILSLVPSAWSTTNCSIITYQITNISTPNLAGCTGWQGYTPGGYAYTQQTTFHVSGYQTQTGYSYAQATLSLSQIGHCWVQLSGSVQDCRPLYTAAKVTPPSATGYNYDQITFESLDGYQVSYGSHCGISYGATQFWQCLAEGCQSSAPPNPCPTGEVTNLGETKEVCYSPIIIDVSGKGFFLTAAKDGVSFDISGTGHPIQMGWTAHGAQNAFLALPGLDGLVHNGKELFGNFTPQPPSYTPNGFAALAVYDSNHDGVIDARDPVFKSLRLWIDENHDGICQLSELHTLAELGVNSISLKYHYDQWHDQFGNAFRYRAGVSTKDNDKDDDHWTFDVFFVHE
jgi:hypothetical protein